ncbi:MAG: hypothetical protein ACREF4_05600 [Gammaproteobacteria bacterium]
MAGEVFFVQSDDVVITPGLRETTPPKSLYRKLFVLCTFILGTRFGSEEALYGAMRRKDFREFRTPIMIEPKVVKYEFVSRETFQRYMGIGRELGLLDEGRPIRLTEYGKRMVRRDGRLFNQGLFERVERMWKQMGLSITDLEDALRKRIKRGHIPSANGLFVDLYLRDRKIINGGI